MKKYREILYIGLLVLIDQVIKIYIFLNYMGKEEDIIKGFLSFYPKFNRDYSWINSLFQFGIGQVPHIILVSLILIGLLLFFDFLKTKKNIDKVIWYAFIFIISGAICSLIDKIVWNGSLDYIYLKGFFIFDLKDLYSNVFIILIILSLIVNYKEFRDINEIKILKEFFVFIKAKYIKRNDKD